MILESEGIINLACYSRINVVVYNNKFQICAFLTNDPVTSLEDRNFDLKTITLATYDNELDANYCLWHLYHTLQSGENSWNPEDVKMPSDAWKATKKEFRSTELHIKNVVKTARLCLSGLYEWTIEYDPNIDVRYKKLPSADYAAAAEKLHNILDSELTKEIQIEWTQGEVPVLIAELEKKANKSISDIVNHIDPDNKLYSADHLTFEQLYEIETHFDLD